MDRKVTSSYATASMIFEVFNAHKLLYHDTVGISSRGAVDCSASEPVLK
jgi:hypothetical protein